MRQDTQPHSRGDTSGFPGRDLINAVVRNRRRENAGDPNSDLTSFQAHPGLHQDDCEEYRSEQDRNNYCTDHAGRGHLSLLFNLRGG